MEPGIFRPRGRESAERQGSSDLGDGTPVALLRAVANPFRLCDSDYAGRQRYFLTMCTFRRRKHFTDGALVDRLRSQFLHTSEAHDMAILAYCFMPDHYHAVVEGIGEHARLPTFVHRAKQLTGFAFKRMTGEPLWQRSYFDRTLRSEDGLPKAIGYLIANPTRAGLVDRTDAYPYWGSEKWTRTELLEFLVNEGVLRG